MKRYANRSGGSGVAAYQLTADAIRVRFANSDRVYEYSHASAGMAHVDAMKRLAREGRGLGTHISRHVSDRYVR